MILIRRQSTITKEQLKEQRDKIFRRQSVISQDYRANPNQRSHNIVVLNVRGNFYEVNYDKGLNPLIVSSKFTKPDHKNSSILGISTISRSSRAVLKVTL